MYINIVWHAYDFKMCKSIQACLMAKKTQQHEKLIKITILFLHYQYASLLLPLLYGLISSLPILLFTHIQSHQWQLFLRKIFFFLQLCSDSNSLTHTFWPQCDSVCSSSCTKSCLTDSELLQSLCFIYFQ